MISKIIKYAIIIAAFSLISPRGAYADKRLEFDDSSVIVSVNDYKSDISLFSNKEPWEEILKGLGVSEIERLDEDVTEGISVFSAGGTERLLKLTLAESGEENVLKLIDTLNGIHGIEYAQPNYYYYLEGAANDPYYSGGYQYNLSKTEAENVWELDIDCSGTAVAILDSGINMTHEDLKDNLWENPGEIAGNGVDDDGNGYIDDICGWDFVYNDNNPEDGVGHGTHVAGIISAVTGNNKGIASIACNAKLVPLRIFNSSGKTSTEITYKALQYIRSMNIPVANCSWGGNEYDVLIKRYMRLCTDTVFVAAAGNEASDNDNTPTYPASFGISNEISVGSTDSYDTLSSFSNYGASSVDIAAPGTGIYSAYIGGRNRYTSMDGTSMAAPLVSSAVAVVRSANPQLNAAKTISCILDSADKLSGLSGKIIGARRLNAYNAVLMANPALAATSAPNPTQIPTAAPASIPEVKAVNVSNDGDTVNISLEFYGNENPSAGEINIYAIYKEKGLLKYIEPLKLNDALEAEFTISEKYADCGAEIYVWSKSMQPLCDSIKLENLTNK